MVSSWEGGGAAIVISWLYTYLTIFKDYDGAYNSAVFHAINELLCLFMNVFKNASD